MSSSDWVIKQGDSLPVFSDTLTLSDGTTPNLAGATLKFVVRNANATPVTLTGTPSIVNPTSGAVQYAPTVADTATPGTYQASWVVDFAAGGQMTFPTVGYLALEIEPSLSGTSVPQLLVDLETVKQYPGMSIPGDDRHIDARLVGFIQAVQPMIEHITGPILIQTYDEYYQGGNNIISLSHRPSVGYGTSPVLNVLACSEFIGPTEYPLSQVQSPAFGSIYSYEVNVRLGRITRRTAGGGTLAFPASPEGVHVVYEAGQASVPHNVREATLELIRINFQTSQPVGRGRRTVADDQDTNSQPGISMPRDVRRMLQPTARGPAFA